MSRVTNRAAKLSPLLLGIAVVAVFGLTLRQIAFAASGSLSLNPSSGTHINGDTFTVTVVENSGTDAANAIDASVTFDSSKLHFVGDTVTAPFNLNFNGTDTASGSTVFVQRGQLGTSSTGSQTVTVLTFQATATGTAAVSFNGGSSKIYSAADNSNLLTTSSGASFTINAPPPAAPTINSFVATPSSVSPGQTSSLSWTTSNVVASGCNIGTSLTGGAPSGSWTTPALSTSASYTLTCKNSANVTVSKAVTVTVATGGTPSGGGGGGTGGGSSSSNKSTSVNVNNVTVPNNGNVDVSSPSVTVGPSTVQSEGVNKVEYYLNGKLVDTETKAPFTYRVDTTKLDNGNYSLVSKTYYSNGSTKEATQHLTVKNTAKKVSNSSIGISLVLLAAIIGGVILIQRRRSQFKPGAYAAAGAHDVVTSDAPVKPETVSPKPTAPIIPAPINPNAPQPGSVIGQQKIDKQ